METRNIKKHEIGAIHNRSIDDIEEWFLAQNYHAIPGDRITNIEEWQDMTEFDSTGEIMACYQEDIDGEPYIFGKCAVYADPDLLYIVALSIDGKETGFYALLCDDDIIYG